jgi:hypothetical protein
MYKSSTPNGAGPTAAGATPGANGAAGEQKPKDNVVDAEFVDVEDKK